MVDATSLRILVTGASTGVGLAIARRLVDTRHRLILTARKESLARFADSGIVESERIWLRALDVTVDGQRREVVDQANARWGGVDVLINNAGVAYWAVVEHVTEQDRMTQMDVNYRSPMELTRLVLPRMREQRWGRIMNLSSVGGMMAMPTMAVYSASKFALEGASEALWYEVRPFGIFVTLLEPGFIHSASFQNSQLTQESAHSVASGDDPYHAHYEHMGPFVARLMDWSRSSPESVARRIERALTMRAPPLRMSGTPDAFLFQMLRRVLPRRAYHAALYRCLPGVSRWGR